MRNKKDKYINVRVTKEQHKQLLAMAEKRDLPISTIIRHAIADQLVTHDLSNGVR